MEKTHVIMLKYDNLFQLGYTDVYRGPRAENIIADCPEVYLRKIKHNPRPSQAYLQTRENTGVKKKKKKKSPRLLKTCAAQQLSCARFSSRHPNRVRPKRSQPVKQITVNK